MHDLIVYKLTVAIRGLITTFLSVSENTGQQLTELVVEKKTDSCVLKLLTTIEKREKKRRRRQIVKAVKDTYREKEGFLNWRWKL